MCDLIAPVPQGLRPGRLSVVIHSLEPGGAERISSILANGLSGRGWTVTILTLAGKEQPVFYALADTVAHEPLGLGRTTALGRSLGRVLPQRLVEGLKRIPLSHVWNLVAKVWRLRIGIRRARPDVVLAFMDVSNIMTLLATLGLGIPVVVSERNDPAQAPLGWVWRVLRHLTYPEAASLVVLTDDTRNWFSPLVRRNVRVIPNPVLPPLGSPRDKASGDSSRKVIAVGRLSQEKGFDLLIVAFSHLASGFPDWNLEIWGEGPHRFDLEALRDRLGLRGRVSFPGLTRSIYDQYPTADLFVLSSRTEGFPNALCEAMAHGLPVVATSCSGGVRDILRSGLDGLLVSPEDPEALSLALARFMNSPSLRHDFGLRAAEITTRFSLGSILDKWDTCLQDAMRGAKGGRD